MKIKLNNLIVLALALVIVASQSYLFSAFEAHVVNVTAKICRHSETRTIGFWKNHPRVYENLIPLTLGGVLIHEQWQVDEIFFHARSKDMIDMLRAQLLAMRFNIAYFGIGDYVPKSEGRPLSEIVAEADLLLINGGKRKDLESMKDVLDGLNNMHNLRFCSAAPLEEPEEPLLLADISEDKGNNKGGKKKEEPILILEPEETQSTTTEETSTTTEETATSTESTTTDEVATTTEETSTSTEQVATSTPTTTPEIGETSTSTESTSTEEMTNATSTESTTTEEIATTTQETSTSTESTSTEETSTSTEDVSTSSPVIIENNSTSTEATTTQETLPPSIPEETSTSTEATTTEETG